MKKESSIINKKTVYTVSTLLKNTALVHSITRKSCLVNIKSHEIIGDFDNYGVTYYPDTLFYFQERDISNPEYYDFGKTDTYINIYDAEKEKFIIKNFKHIKGQYTYAIFQNPVTKKFHLFDMKTIRNKDNIFIEEFDSIKTILEQYYGTYTVVEQNGKKGIYDKKQGKITTPIEYDDIKRINNQEIIIFEKNGKSYFTFHHIDNGIIKSPLFESIECDSVYSDILYCKMDSTPEYSINRHHSTVIYDTGNYNTKLLCKISRADEIKCLDRNSKGIYIFLVKKNGKYGLYGFKENHQKHDDLSTPSCFEIVPPIYDKIEKNNDNYFLYKDAKVGLYTRYQDNYKFKDCIIDPKYDDIKVFNNSYLLFTKEKCDIVTLDEPDTPHVSDCEFVENHSGDIIYKTADKYDIYFPNNKGVNIIDGMDKITYKSRFKYQNLYITERDNKKGIIYNGKELFKPTYKSIEAYGVNESEYYSANFYYFKLETHKNKLAKFSEENSWSEPELHIRDEEYEDIQFYKDFMLLDNGREITLYDYNEKPLKTFPSKTTIHYLKLKKNENEMDIYIINGIYYFYTNGNFERAFMEYYDLYVTKYITNTNSFEVSTYSKTEHDEFCSKIDSQSDEEAERNLLEMTNDSKCITEKYPTLVLKRVNNLNN